MDLASSSNSSRNTVRFADIAGPASDPQQAVDFLRSWYDQAGGERADLIAAITPISESGRTEKSAFGTVSVVVGMIEAAGLDELIYPGGGERRNLYSRVALMSRAPERRGAGHMRDRGGKELSAWSPGLVSDLDVDEGKLGSAGACLDLLGKVRAAGLAPSEVVDSGSGGLHLYWRVDGGVEPKAMELMAARMRAHLLAEIGWGRSGVDGDDDEPPIDDVGDCARILRLPGGLRMPKRGESGPPTRCELLESVPDCLDLDRFAMATSAAWEAEQDRRERLREMRAARAADASATLAGWRSSGGGRLGGWGYLMRVADVEQVFAASVSWDEVLRPAGWTVHGEPDSEGRREWTRPGGAEGGSRGVNPRSLVTDWTASPDVGSLLSTARGTGLGRLRAMRVPLTKMAVAAELHRDGNLAALVGEFVGTGAFIA